MRNSIFFVFLFSCFGLQSQDNEPTYKNRLVIEGLPKLEATSNFEFNSVYLGYGFYSSMMITGNIGVEIRFGDIQPKAYPKISFGYVHLGRFQTQLSALFPIHEGSSDIVLNPQIGYGWFFNIIYILGGYNFNLTNNLDIKNSFNLTLGIQIPLNLERFLHKL
ncbi:MAG: hypothetical protein AAFO82_03300 [Bacteroidota bacterium]